MEEARRLIEELRTLVRKTDKESVRRIEEIVEWFKQNQSNENKILMSKFFAEIADLLNEQIGEVMDLINKEKK